MSALDQDWVKLPNWREATLVLLEIGSVWITEYDRYHSEFMSKAKGSLDFEIIREFLDSCGIEVKKDDDQIQYISKALLKCTSVLNGLETLGIAEKKVMPPLPRDPMKPSEASIKNYMYSITKHGVDIALKLQEHSDNESRYQTQLEINRVMRRNSTIAVWVSGIALAIALGLCTASWMNYHLQKKNLEGPASQASMKPRLSQPSTANNK